MDFSANQKSACQPPSKLKRLRLGVRVFPPDLSSPQGASSQSPDRPSTIPSKNAKLSPSIPENAFQPPTDHSAYQTPDNSTASISNVLKLGKKLFPSDLNSPAMASSPPPCPYFPTTPLQNSNVPPPPPPPPAESSIHSPTDPSSISKPVLRGFSYTNPSLQFGTNKNQYSVDLSDASVNQTTDSSIPSISFKSKVGVRTFPPDLATPENASSHPSFKPAPTFPSTSLQISTRSHRSPSFPLPKQSNTRPGPAPAQNLNRRPSPTTPISNCLPPSVQGPNRHPPLPPPKPSNKQPVSAPAQNLNRLPSPTTPISNCLPPSVQGPNRHPPLPPPKPSNKQPVSAPAQNVNSRPPSVHYPNKPLSSPQNSNTLLQSSASTIANLSSRPASAVLSNQNLATPPSVISRATGTFVRVLPTPPYVATGLNDLPIQASLHQDRENIPFSYGIHDQPLQTQQQEWGASAYAGPHPSHSTTMGPSVCVPSVQERQSSTAIVGK